MKLLKSQKNSLFEIIENFDFFSHNQFEFIENEVMGSYTTYIEYKANKEFNFRFIDSESNNTLYVNYSPGEEQMIDFSSRLNWNQALNYFINWLHYLQREAMSPNLWQKFKNEISDINLVNDFNNQKFSFSEYNEISEKIDILRNSLSTIPLILNQQNEIILRLDHLSEMAKELGKFDWVNLFVGTLMSVVIQLNLTPENANLIWELIKRVFNNYFLPK